MIKNQQIRGIFILGLRFDHLRRDKNLSKLLLRFVLYIVIHFAQFLNNLSRSPITIVQVLQISLIFVKLINRDSF